MATIQRPVFILALDFVLGINVRIAFLEPLPAARVAYYGICFFCLALMIWQPGWTVLVAAFESLITLVALTITTVVRTMIVTDDMIETGIGVVTLEEIGTPDFRRYRLSRLDEGTSWSVGLKKPLTAPIIPPLSEKLHIRSKVLLNNKGIAVIPDYLQLKNNYGR